MNYVGAGQNAVDALHSVNDSTVLQFVGLNVARAQRANAGRLIKLITGDEAVAVAAEANASLQEAPKFELRAMAVRGSRDEAMGRVIAGNFARIFRSFKVKLTGNDAHHLRE